MGGNQFAEALRSWRGLHKAALFETDASKLRLRIDEARRALVFPPELFSAPANRDDESVAIRIGLYALQALENRLRLNTKDPRRSCRTRQISHTRPPANDNSRDSDVEFRQAEALPALRSSGSRSVTGKYSIVRIV